MSARNRDLIGTLQRCLVTVTMLVATAWPVNAVARPPAQAYELKVMSFNIRFSKVDKSEDASENNWADPRHPRRERAIRIIRDFMPDVLGVQEARELQIADLRVALPEFDFYGIGRDDGKTGGEFSGIFCRKDRFDRKDTGSFWLSATPEKPGTTFYAAPTAVPRIASWVRLAEKKTKREFVLLNMHWDHIDAPAREKSAALVRNRLATVAKDSPAIVTGDLNSPEDSTAFIALMGGGDATGRRLSDSYRELHRERSPNESTFDAWNGAIKGSRIDFILHTSEFASTAADIVRTSYDGRWPSDHYPVTATLRLQSKPD